MMSETKTGPLYDTWSRIYDLAFRRMLRHNQLAAIRRLAPLPGDCILDIGVGTGLMLEHYPRGTTVVGIDLSIGMLQRAQTKCREQALADCHLLRADAMRLPFRHASFDHVMVSHTISVVSDPGRLLSEALRLVRPGGRIVIVNHFRSTLAPLAWLDTLINPIAVRLGWRSDLSLGRLLSEAGVPFADHYKTRPLDLWRIVVLTSDDTAPRMHVDPPPAPVLEEPALVVGR